MTDLVSFHPTKKLFIDILTQDLSISECILDLLDNSVDSYTRNNINEKRDIQLNFDKNELILFDNCGGIDKEKLKNEVFRFGAKDFLNHMPTIGVYGIGLKRSIFKLGEITIFETDDGKDYCKLRIDVEDWKNKKDKKGNEVWNLPLTETSSSKLGNGEKPYTKITIEELRYETKETFSSEFESKLKNTIKIYYSRYIQNDKIDFFVNAERQYGFEIKVKASDDFKPVKVEEEYKGVEIKIFCWLDLKEEQLQKRLGKEHGHQGWNIFMNERLVIFDDTSEETGWREGGHPFLPKFHPIYNQFRGVVLLNTNDPSKLPINTAKTGFNKEKEVYEYLLKLMIKVARPFIDFLSDKYNNQKEEIDEKEEKLFVSIDKDSKDETGIVEASIDDTTTKYQSAFIPPAIAPRPIIPQSRISYYKPKSKVEIMKQILKVRTNYEVGEKTFDSFWESEDLDGEE